MVSVLECRVERESFTDREVRALIADARQDERERCRDRINALIEAVNARSVVTQEARAWNAARLAALMAARSAVMRGDDDAPPL